MIKQLNTCGPTLQERAVHLLTQHLEKDESIKSSIDSIVRGLQFNPSLLDFCKDCSLKGKLSVSNMTELIDYFKNEKEGSAVAAI